MSLPKDTFYNPYDTPAQHAYNAPSPQLATACLTIALTTQAELLHTGKAALMKGGIDHLLIELCASHSSELAQSVPH